MQWKGYLPYEASWSQRKVTTSMRGTFQQAKPERCNNSRKCDFRVAVERHLKSRSLLPVRLFFREKVPGKGLSRERRTFFEKDDFNAIYFPLG